MVWRFLGNASQPVLGAAEWLLSPLKPAPKPVVLPTGFDPIPPTPRPELEAAVKRLDSKKAEWSALGPKERATLLRSCIPTTVKAAKEAAVVSTQAKGSYGAGVAEEWLVWLPVVSGLRELAEALEAGGAPKPMGIRTRPDGQLVVDVFPVGMEALLYGGFRGETWILPGKPATQGHTYKEGCAPPPGIAMVLGAGNQLPVVGLDILHKLVLDGEVVVLKMNPVNEYLGPYLRKAFQPLVDAGFVEIVYGEGAFLVNHPLVSSVHLTGSAATYDAIVWGNNKDKKGDPPFKKPVGAELGCVTPYIVVPGGEWSQADLEYHADSIVTGVVGNAGHNCLKAEILVTDKEWPQREALLNAVRAKLNALPRRVAFYPGSEKRFAAFKRHHPDAEELGTIVEEENGVPTSPYLIRTGLTPDEANTQDENWCAVLQEVAIPGTGGDPEKFMEAAAKFANDRCWGTLSCSVFIHPSVSSSYPEAYDKLIADLRYGSVVVNAPTVLGFVTTKCVWGGYPGSTPQDIGSGNCFVHNTVMFDHPQKSVIYGPWVFHPYPFWSAANRNLEALAPAAINFFANPNPVALLPAAVAALRG